MNLLKTTAIAIFLLSGLFAACDLPGWDPAEEAKRAEIGDLAGIWSNSSVSGERYESLATGELSDPSGTIIEYEIFPSGAVRHVGYLSTTVYSCTTKLFIHREGQVRRDEETLTFDFEAGKRIYQACSESSKRNETIPATRETVSYTIERDEEGEMKLCLLKEDGEVCLYKKRGY